MLMTVLSMSVVVAPQAKAAASAGDLIKINGLSSVYYLGANGKKYVFPNEATYFSWFNDWSGVVPISQSEMDSYGLPVGNVVMRPGTKLVKSPSVNTVYAVEPNGVLRSIVSEANAINLWGADWAKKVVDIPDSFISNYNGGTPGAPLALGQYPVGQLIKTAGSPDVMLLSTDGTARKFASQAAFDANNYSFNYVATVPSTYVMPTTGSLVNGMEAGLDTVSQNGASVGPVAGGSGLSVAVASDSPAASTIPEGAPADFLKFNVTASNDGAVNINALKLTAGGLGIATAIDSVTVYANGVRYGSSKGIDSNKIASFNFSNPIVVAAGQTVSILVRAIVTSDTNQHTLGIAAAADISTNGSTVSGSFPITGNVMSAANVAVGTLTAAAGTTPTNPKLGDTQALISSLQLTNGNVEDINLKSLTLKRTAGTATDADFANVNLYVNGVKVASSAGFTNKYVTFNLDTPYLIKKSTAKKFDVKADIIDGGTRTLTVSLDATSDVIAQGLSYNTNSIIAGSYAGTSITISAGAISLGKVEAANDKVRKDSTVVDFGTINITGNTGKNVTFDGIYVTMTGTGTDYNSSASLAWAGLSNVGLKDLSTGNIYDLTYDSGTTAKKYKATSLGINLANGVTKGFMVVADTNANASTSATYAASIASAVTASVAGDLTVTDEDSNTNITDITPNTLTLNAVTIQSPAITFSVNALSTTYTQVVGSSNVKVLSFNIAANSTDDLTVTDLVIRAASGVSQASSSLISQYRLYQDDGSASGILVKAKSGSAASVSANSTVDFDALSINVPKGQTVKYFVTVDFVNDNSKAGCTTKWGLSAYTAQDNTKQNSVYDATNDTNSNGAFDNLTSANVLSARTVTLVGSGSLIVSMNNTTADTLKNSYQIASYSTGILAAIDMRATNENVIVTSLSVEQFIPVLKTLNITNAPLMFSSLSLLDSDKTTVIKTISNVTASTTFNDLTLTVPQTTKTFYLKGETNAIVKDGIGALNASTTFNVSDVVAKGSGSNLNLGTNATSSAASNACTGGDICYVVPTGVTGAATSGYPSRNTPKTATSTTATILASKISSVDLVSSGGGCSVASSLSSGWNTVAIVKVTTDNTGANTLLNGDVIKTVLNTIAVDYNITKATTSGALGATIEKCGGSDTAIATTTPATGTESGRMSFAVSGMTNDNKIAAQTTVYYAIKLNVSAVSSVAGASTVEIDLNNLDLGTARGNFTWKDSSDANAKYALLLTNNKVTGVKITN